MFNGINPIARFRDPEFRRFLTFLLVGGLNTLVGYLIFAALIVIGLSSTAAIVVGTVLGVLFNFASTGGIVFKNRSARRLPRFIGVYVVQMLLGIWVLASLEGAGVPTLIAGAIAVPPLAVFTYFAMKRFVYS